MKQCILTVYIPDNNVRDSVHVAQMMRECRRHCRVPDPDGKSSARLWPRRRSQV